MSQKTNHSHSPNSKVGIKEIAAKLNVSIGTVDRALHGRAGINPLTAAKTLKAAAGLILLRSPTLRLVRSATPGETS